MRHIAAYIILLGTISMIWGCTRQAEPVEGVDTVGNPVEIEAVCETMTEADEDAPSMEDMPDDDQGIIHF